MGILWFRLHHRHFWQRHSLVHGLGLWLERRMISDLKTTNLSAWNWIELDWYVVRPTYLGDESAATGHNWYCYWQRRKKVVPLTFAFDFFVLTMSHKKHFCVFKLVLSIFARTTSVSLWWTLLSLLKFGVVNQNATTVVIFCLSLSLNFASMCLLSSKQFRSNITGNWLIA